MYKIIDSHCHLPHQKYGKSLEQIIATAQSAGVVRLVNIGTSINENEEALKVSSTYAQVYSALAIYPHEHIGDEVAPLVEALEKQLVSSPKVIALGECGIDITDWKGGRSINDQVELFERQIQLSIRHKLPLIIHNRNGDQHVIDLLKKYSGQATGVIHCFSSTWDSAAKFIDLGFYISFAGNITYKANLELREVVKKMPLNRIIAETDSPYLSPEGFRGKPNEPANVVEVVKKIAETRGDTFDNIANIAYSNTCSLFRFDI